MCCYLYQHEQSLGLSALALTAMRTIRGFSFLPQAIGQSSTHQYRAISAIPRRLHLDTLTGKCPFCASARKDVLNDHMPSL